MWPMSLLLPYSALGWRWGARPAELASHRSPWLVRQPDRTPALPYPFPLPFPWFFLKPEEGHLEACKCSTSSSLARLMAYPPFLLLRRVGRVRPLSNISFPKRFPHPLTTLYATSISFPLLCSLAFHDAFPRSTNQRKGQETPQKRKSEQVLESGAIDLTCSLVTHIHIKQHGIGRRSRTFSQVTPMAQRRQPPILPHPMSVQKTCKARPTRP